MIKNYVFDFGNVLARFDKNMLTAAHVTDRKTADLIADVLFDRLYWDRLDNGSITDDEVKSEVCKRLPPDLHDVARTVYDKWVVSMPPIDGMPELIADIKAKGAKLYLLSNISVGFAKRYHECPWIKELFSLFDGLVFSGPIGMTKPNRDIFEYLLEKYSLDAKECIFIDDSELNINGAKAAGLNTYRFDSNADKLREYLRI